MRLGLTPLTAAVLLAAGVPTAGAASDALVEARLVVDTAAPAPGSQLWAGVHLVMAEGWHVYWHNPGESGLATEVRWEDLGGVEISPTQWPAPAAFESPGGISSYGYGGEVVLPARLLVPAEGWPRQPLAAWVGWLACREKCVLGEARLELELPVTAAVAARGRELIEDAVAATPAPAEAAPFAVRTVTGPDTGDGAGDLVAWLSWPAEAPARVEWFPAPGEGLRVTEARAASRGALTRLDARVGRDRPEASLPGVLVATDDAGRRSAWAISLAW